MGTLFGPVGDFHPDCLGCIRLNTLTDGHPLRTLTKSGVSSWTVFRLNTLTDGHPLRPDTWNYVPGEFMESQYPH